MIGRVIDGLRLAAGGIDRLVEIVERLKVSLKEKYAILGGKAAVALKL